MYLKTTPAQIGIGGTTIEYLCFADDIDVLARKEEELAKLESHLDKTSMRYGMEINAGKKNKLMMNGDKTITAGTAVHGQKLETAYQFRYLRTIISGKV